MALSFSTSGTFDKTDKFLAYMAKGGLYKNLQSFAERGVAALAAATPTDSGVSAESWDYILEVGPGYAAIWWTNNHVDANGAPIVVLLEYGHGTGTGGYVQGRDFINPAIAPIMDEIANEVWKEVQSA
jgi:hypothetical protein